MMVFEMKHYEYEINLFLDNELPPRDQKELFMHLAVCNECSELFHQYNKIKKETNEYFSNIDVTEAESITLPLAKENKSNTTYRKYFYFSSAAAVIFLLLFVFQYNQSADKSIKLYNSAQKISPAASSSNNSGEMAINGDEANYAGTKKQPANYTQKVIKEKQNITESTGDNIDSIIFNEDLFNLTAGQDFIQNVKDNKNGIKKYFSGDYVDSPSIITNLKLTYDKNGISDFEKNLYEQLKADPALNNILPDSLTKESAEYIRNVINQNEVNSNKVRDLKFHNTPFMDKDGKFTPADIASIRDLLLREADRYKMKPAKEKNYKKKNVPLIDGIIEIPIDSATFKKEGDLVLTAYPKQDKSNRQKVVSFEVVFKGDTLSDQLKKIKVKVSKGTK